MTVEENTYVASLPMLLTELFPVEVRARCVGLAYHLGAIAAAKVQARDPFRRHWVLLSLLFVYLSFDELTRMHENWGNVLNAPLASWRNREVLGGALRNLWVLPAALVAGVVGKKKFIYDLWGDTVNTASRMESHGVPGMVHVAESSPRLLAGKYRMTARGTIEVKGKGAMETWFLHGRIDDA